MKRDGAQNQSFYSFGGRKMIREETEKEEHLLNPIFRDYNGKVVPQETVLYRKTPNYKVTDYTKNISQSIFSPGQLLSYKVVNKNTDLRDLRRKVQQQEREMAQHGMVASRNSDSKAAKRTKSANPTTRMLNRFANKLNEEAKRKMKLRAEIDEIRSNLSVFQASIASGRV